jgi:hypothetical protein
MNILKEAVKSCIPDYQLNKIKFYLRNKAKHLKIWRENNQPTPPPHEWKQLIIKFYAAKYGINIFVETGTYLGDMIAAQVDYFDQLYSVELGNKLWNDATKRFSENTNVCVINGDSSKELINIMHKLDKDALFWLDGHYSEGITARGNTDCPIFDELKTILLNNNFHHVLLIDDARCFDGNGDYPTIQNLEKVILEYRSNYKVEVINDIIIAA